MCNQKILKNLILNKNYFQQRWNQELWNFVVTKILWICKLWYQWRRHKNINWWILINDNLVTQWCLTQNYSCPLSNNDSRDWRHGLRNMKLADGKCSFETEKCMAFHDVVGQLMLIIEKNLMHLNESANSTSVMFCLFARNSNQIFIETL